MKILETHDLCKRYGTSNALNNINIQINKGEIYGLLGRNGAGKTTLMKMILGLTDITSGDIKLFGKDLSLKSEIYSRIGAHLDLQGFYPELSAYENLTVFSSIRGITKKNAVKDTLEKVGLSKEKNKKYKEFSLGMKKRLGLANAIVHEPELLIIDEPTNGLDPIGIEEFRNYLIKISRENNITILISSHMLSEISIMADRIAIIEQGNLLAEKSMEEIKLLNKKYLELSVTNVDIACRVLEKECNIFDYEVLDKDTIRIFDMAFDKNLFSRTLARHQEGILGIYVKEDGLEQYFKSLISSEARFDRR